VLLLWRPYPDIAVSLLLLLLVLLLIPQRSDPRPACQTAAVQREVAS
jgi:hypothetical protein